MARSKEFDPERALDKAMRLSWRSGYEKISLAALMHEMGIAKQSLYDTFGDKRSLYLRALAHYRERTNGEMQRMLNQIPSVKDGFRKNRENCPPTKTRALWPVFSWLPFRV